MNKEQLHQELLEMMEAEQQQFRNWLMEQPPEEILQHANEYSIREDILLAMEGMELEPLHAKVLLKTGQPLTVVYREWDKQDFSYHMDNISDVILSRAQYELEQSSDFMEIRIFQIDRDRDENRVCFLSLDSLPKFQKSEQVDSSIYNCVYAGKVECRSLEDVYTMFNLNHPEDFTGRSLSVSDVVQVVKQSPAEPEFYFCDSVGFAPVAFDPDQTKDMSKAIWVLYVEPNKQARATLLNNTLEDIQRAVGGYIEVVYHLNNNRLIICNEEGKALNFPLNRAIRDEEGRVVDIITGNFFICSSAGNEFASLSREQMEECKKEFLLPQRIYHKKNGEIAVKEIKPRDLER